MSEIPFFNRALLKLQFAARLKRIIDQADLAVTVTRLLMFAAMAGLFARAGRLDADSIGCF